MIRLPSSLIQNETSWLLLVFGCESLNPIGPPRLGEDIMLASSMRYFVVASGLLLVVSSLGRADRPDEIGAWRLKRNVEDRQRQLTRAQRELAEACARLALAEGNRELAITELRKAVACCQGEVDWIRDHANQFCDPRDPMDQAQWDLANARAWLAEVSGDTASLVAAWKQIVGFHEQRLERVQRLEQMRAVKAEEVSIVQQALEGARQRLGDAEKQLSAERPKKLDESK
jgi:hypothetical protein